MVKRGQAATEFLTTYSWAILILLLVIAVIFGLNLFNPKVPNSCVGSDPITCNDVKITAGNPPILTLRLTASGISTTSSTRVTEIRLGVPTSVSCNLGSGMTLQNDVPVDVSCGSWNPSITLKEGAKFRGTAKIEYYLPGSMNTYTSIVVFSGTVE